MSAAAKAGRDSQAKWRQHVAAWRASGKSQAAYCREHGLGYYRFHYWKRKFGKAQDNPRLRLVPVSGLNTESPTVPADSEEVECIQTGQITAEPNAPTKSGIRLLIREITIELDTEFDDSALAQAISVLRSRQCG